MRIPPFEKASLLQDALSATMTKTWLPLESNPDVMNDYVSKMGLDLSKIQFHDVMSTEEWALEMIPRPVLGSSEFFCGFLC